MKYKVIDGREYPVVNAKQDALIDLRYMQKHYKSNPTMRMHWEGEEEERNLAPIRKQLELCEIELPESVDPLEWLVSPEGLDIVSQMYGRAILDDPNHRTDRLYSRSFSRRLRKLI
jgi:hypothetical protein